MARDCRQDRWVAHRRREYDVQMKHRETLALESDTPIKLELLLELSEHLQQAGIEVYTLDVEAYSLQRCQKLLIEKGSRSILSVEELQEAVLPKAETKDRDLLVKVLRDQLQVLSPSRGLIIIDPFFFSSRENYDRADYISIFREVFGSVVAKIASIRFITKPRYDIALYQNIRQVLADLNPQISINLSTTDDFHDRYWIIDETKGLFVGTSLNGIGIRYALTDYIKDVDIAAIMEELRRLSLL